MTRPLVAVFGAGATGTSVVRSLAPHADLSVYDPDTEAMGRACALFGGTPAGATGGEASVVVLATPSVRHVQAARSHLSAGRHVVSINDDPEVIVGLLELDAHARQCERSLVIGAGFAPGLTCVLARFAADQMDVVHELAVWKQGTGGPACARQHHRALKNPGAEWVDGRWVDRRGGSGRDLVWFPGQIGAHDSYRAALGSPQLLHRSFPQAQRISARVTANRRDRMTSRLPMLRPPHPDGGPGGVRVEVRGLIDGGVQTLVYGVVAHPSSAAGSTAAVAVRRIVAGEFAVGASGMSEVSDPASVLRDVRHDGIKVHRFDGFLA